jgi:predicted CXXCH cytochrome family protein
MSKRLVVAAIVIGLIALTCSLACQKREAVQAEAPAKAQAEVAQAEVPIYDRAITPLSPEECGRCHLPIFTGIKEAGGKHQFDCQDCHTIYHTTEDIMPECSACHVTASGSANYHGDDPAVTECLTCHADPHRPLDIPVADITDDCGKCHATEQADLVNHPSMHTDAVGCADCHHTEHGYVPNCNECHGNHSPQIEIGMQECMGCHPVHKPLSISYVEQTSSLICAGCHAGPYDQLTAKETKHSHLTCAECHPHHAEIDPCSKCHGQPHSSAMMQDMSKCQSCHGHAHNLAAD